MRIDLQSPDRDMLRRAAETVRQGGVVLYPTDTIYGLGCDPRNATALRRLFRIKGRPEERGVLVLAPDLGSAFSLISGLHPEAREILDRYWPGPLTGIFPAAEDLPGELTGGTRTIGVRVPSLPLLRLWMEELGGPLVSTSANRSGEPVPTDLAKLRELFESVVDLFLEAGEPASTTPSTVVDFTTRPFRVVRQGELRVILDCP